MGSSASRFLLIPELVHTVLDGFDSPSDLVRLACVNRAWNRLALQRLYKGSVVDFRFRSPDIFWIDSLKIASKRRFAENFAHTKHLMIAPRTAEVEKPWLTGWHARLVCTELCRALSRRKDAEMLLRPVPDGGFRSLTIPFELVRNKISDITDLLFHPKLESLTIDCRYCVGLGALYSEHPHQEEMKSLVALSIFVSVDGMNINWLNPILVGPSLRIFSMQQPTYSHEKLWAESEVWRDTLSTLATHKDLEALALDLECPNTDFTSIISGLESSRGEKLWPQLKALYLDCNNESWSKILLSWTELRILKLSNLNMEIRNQLFRFTRLRVLRVSMMDPSNCGWLISIADSCPLLRYLRVHLGVSSEGETSELDHDQFTQLLKNLPRIEVLIMSVRIPFLGRHLFDITTYCPRLMYLDLRFSCAVISKETLDNTRPLTNLRVFKVDNLLVPSAEKYIGGHALRSMARSWRKAFPCLLEIPCLLDLFDFDPSIPGFRRMEDHPDSYEPGIEQQATLDDYDPSQEITPFDVDEWSSDLRAAFDHEMSVWQKDSQITDRELYNENRKLRRRIWVLLGYFKPRGWSERARHRWLCDYEVQLFGWPIIPAGIYRDPDKSDGFGLVDED